MQINSDRTRVFLLPGEYHFDRIGSRIRTLLGSCVAVTLWHPQRRVGGMCHFLLPGRVRTSSTPFDGKYADEALALLVKEMTAVGTVPREYEAKLFGGGNMFQVKTSSGMGMIGRKNALAAKQLMNHYGILIKEESLEGSGHRNVEFDVSSGKVMVKHKRLTSETKQCDCCENRLLCYGGAICGGRPAILNRPGSQ